MRIERWYSKEAFQKTLGTEPYIHPTATVLASDLGEWVEIGARSSIHESAVGDYSYVCQDVYMDYTTIGKFCSIAAHTRFNPGNHPMKRVTQHHMTYRRKQFGLGEDDAEFFAWRKEASCTLGNDVWVGHGALILSGVTVGTGAVIGAGAVVTHDVPDYAVVAGVPARIIRYRFGEEEREALLASKWWEWGRETLEKRFEELLDSERFIRQQKDVKA